jgi:hypothetical protein
MALFVGEFRCQENANNVERQFRPDGTRSHADDVHIVVFHALVGGVAFVTEPGANAPDLVRGK